MKVADRLEVWSINRNTQDFFIYGLKEADMNDFIELLLNYY